MAAGRSARDALRREDFPRADRRDHRPSASAKVAAAGAMAWAPTQLAWAQGDQMGFDLLKLLGAVPSLVLHALGEFALALLAVLLLTALAAWIVARVRSDGESGRGKSSSLLRHLRGPLPVIAITIVVGAAVLFHGSNGGPGKSSRPKGPRLQSPTGKAWPDKTGYLDMPQSPSTGVGVIRLTHRSSGGRVYVKLCEAGEGSCPGLRHAIIQKYGEFDFRGLPAGTFEVRMIYIDPPTVAGKSRPIRIDEGSGEAVVVRLPAEPVLDSRDPVYGVPKEQF